MRVGLLVTCLADLMRPSIGLAALKLLEQAGCEVVVPQTQTCCGQPGYNSGDRVGAQALARKLISEFGDCDYVVVPSGSCSGMIKTHYTELLSEIPSDRTKAEWLAARTWELTDFLVNVAGLEKIDARFEGSITRSGVFVTQAGLPSSHMGMQPVGLLCSTGITPLPRYYEPRRLPTCRACAYDFASALGSTHMPGIPGSSVSLSTRAVPIHPGGPDGCLRSFFATGNGLHTSPGGWPPWHLV